MQVKIYKINGYQNGIEQPIDYPKSLPQGYIVENLTPYLEVPVFTRDNLDEELDTALIKLFNYPIANAIEPTTKMVIEFYDNDNLIRHYHMIVKNDTVEKFILSPNVFEHSINLIEASAITQNYLVDDMSVTYRLKDVDLNYDINYDNTVPATPIYIRAGSTENVSYSPKNAPFCTSEYERSYYYANGLGASGNGQEDVYYGKIIGVKSYKFEIEGNYGNTIENIKYGMAGQTINITIPKFKAYKAIENDATFTDYYYSDIDRDNGKKAGYHTENAFGSWESLCYCSTITTIKRIDINTGAVVGIQTIISNPQSLTEINQEYYNKSWQYSNDGYSGNRLNVELRWNESKSKLKLCPASAIAINEEISLTLEANTQYVIETKLNTTNNVGVLFTNVEIESWIDIPFSGIKTYANFLANTEYNGSPNYGVPYASANFVIGVEQFQKIKILKQPAEYNLFDLIKKAILTTQPFLKKKETPILDTTTPFYFSSKNESLLRGTPINETTFVQKNLWEVLIQVGYYIHAIPYIEFGRDDGYIIEFLQLGSNIENSANAKPLTIFNSRDFEEYYTSLSSYLKNVYNPENIIDEYIPFKTISNNYLVSNDTCNVQTTKLIMQINNLFIVDSNGKEYDITDRIFEKSIYDTLTFDVQKFPSKQSSIFYTLNSSLIDGLNYMPEPKPDISGMPIEYPYAIKWIIGHAIFGANVTSLQINELKINDYCLHIKYNTSDIARLTQFKPDIANFFKNSKHDKYPIHEQFYGQPDKIVDSERFGNNQFGELLKLGNEYYEIQEFAEGNNLKTVGQIFKIDRNPYYINQIETEHYPNLILQKIKYSRDFNALSKVVGIPSEPRFYEIATQNIVTREIRINEFISIINLPKDESIQLNIISKTQLINPKRYGELLSGWLFGINPQYPDYAINTFKKDIDTHHQGANQIYFDKNNIPQDFLQTQVPVLRYSFQNSLIFEWDMEDNFCAGSFIDTHMSGNNDTVDKSYYGLRQLRYCDMFGRVDLSDIMLIKNDAIEIVDIQKLPNRVCSDKAISNKFIGCNDLIVLKDNRESLSFNTQINLISKSKQILFGKAIWNVKTMPCKIAFLKNELSKFAYQNIYSDVAMNVLGTTFIKLTESEPNDVSQFLRASFDLPSDINISDVKAVVIIDGGTPENPLGGMPYIIRNCGNLTNEEKLYDFVFVPENFNN